VLRLVGEQPGITVREIAGRLGVDSTGLYRVVKRLTEEERIRKDGTALYPSEPETDPGSTPQSAAADGGEAAADGQAQTPTATASTETASPTTETSTASPRDT
jgi:transposase-like protein